MTLNFDDLAGMRSLAAQLGVKFRYDTLVCPRTDGGMSPVSFRLSSQQMAFQDLDDDFESCQRIFAGFWDRKPLEALTCGAGVFAFNINPYGVMSPCTMFRSFQYPLEGVPFIDAWKRMVGERAARRDECIAAECRSCSMLLICSNCPAWSELEAGSLGGKVEYICDYAKRLEKEFLERQSGEKTKRRGYEEKAVSETGA
jgi:radical SAM protein with 4Fe4S-binding SPASM domain